MINIIHIIRPEFCTRYRYTSDNSYDKHFYISFAAHIEGEIHHPLSLWDWLLGKPAKEKIDQHLSASFYKQRIHWYRLDGTPATIDEEVALNVAKDFFDRRAGRTGGPKFANQEKGISASWPVKHIDAQDLPLS